MSQNLVAQAERESNGRCVMHIQEKKGDGTVKVKNARASIVHTRLGNALDPNRTLGDCALPQLPQTLLGNPHSYGSPDDPSNHHY